MKNNDKQYYIYLRATKEEVPVSKEEFDAYYHDIDLYRRNQQRHGKCVCPANKRLTCDMDCLTCPFHRAGDQVSLNTTVNSDSEDPRDWVEDIEDGLPLLDEIVTEAAEMKELYTRLCELMPEAVEIGRLRLSGHSDRQIESEIGIGRKTFAYRIAKVKSILGNEFPDFF